MESPLHPKTPWRQRAQRNASQHELRQQQKPRLVHEDLVKRLSLAQPHEQEATTKSKTHTSSAGSSYNCTAAVAHGAVIRVYDGAGNVVATHEHKGGFKEW